LYWNKEKLPQQWKESVIVVIYNKGYETECSDCRGISLLQITYKNLSCILLSWLTAYIDEIIGDNHCGF
jgi:hypothetical protein